MTDIQLYNNPLISLNTDGTIDMVASTKQEAMESVAYVWGVGEGVERIKEFSNWARGDILQQLRERYEDLDLGEIIENSEKNYKTAYRLLKTSEAWPAPYRCDEVCHSVHAEIAMTKGLDAMKRIAVLGLAHKHELGTSKVRQVAKHIARSENQDETLESFQACEDTLALEELTEANRSSRIRYIQICQTIGFLEGFTSMPTHRPGHLVIDTKTKCYLDSDGNPHELPIKE